MTSSRGNAPDRIFISYRREDTGFPAGWLFERLATHFGNGRVFKDVDSIDLGDDFVERITAAVGSCDVLLALIGDRWLSITDQDGRRRIDTSDDFVRLEIEAALTRNVRVIPILVGGAQMPRADELPESIAGLEHRQALELSHNRFDSDLRPLLRVLDKSFTEVQPSPTATTQGHPAATQQDAQGQAWEAERAMAEHQQQVEEPQDHIGDHGIQDGAGAVPGGSKTPGLSAARKKGWILGGVIVGTVLVAVVAVIFATSRATPSSNIIFRDDFSSAAHNWSAHGVSASGRYTNGKYQISLNPAKGSYAFATPYAPNLDPAPSSIMVEVSVSQVVAASDFYYGIACRSDATSAYDYEFQIQQGYVQIIKYVNGDPKTLAASSMATWRANGSNQLRVSCTRAGDQNAVHLVFWVNGKKLGDAIDRTSPLANGMVGLITDRTGGTKTVTSVEFDNFVVRRV